MKKKHVYIQFEIRVLSEKMNLYVDTVEETTSPDIEAFAEYKAAKYYWDLSYCSEIPEDCWYMNPDNTIGVRVNKVQEISRELHVAMKHLKELS